jgi:3-hydroxyacyl-CoA dehydrogenase
MFPDFDDVQRIAVLGTGTIGASWTAYFLARGFAVQAYDPAADGEKKLRQFIDNAWPTLQALGMTEHGDAARWQFFSDPAAAVQNVQFVQENAPERLDVKQTLFERIEHHLPEAAIVSSSSSGLLISDIQAGREGAERYIIGHPFNPPHLIPLVEVVGGIDTDPAGVDWAIGFYNAIGKKAIRINKEVPGHLVNRLQAALIREAVYAVDDGIASVADVDTGIAYGPGLRWALMGPHLILHLAGGEGGLKRALEHFGPPMEKWWHDLGEPSYTPDVCEKLIEGVEQEAAGRSIGELAAERDALLFALLDVLQKTRKSFKS